MHKFLTFVGYERGYGRQLYPQIFVLKRLILVIKKVYYTKKMIRTSKRLRSRMVCQLKTQCSVFKH